MNLVYNILYYLSVPLILIRLWWKGRKLSAYRQNIKARFAYYTGNAPQNTLWLHAVSYGEMVAAEQMVQHLINHYPAHTIIITNMTATGAQRAKTRFANTNDDRVIQTYIPYDLPGATRRFLEYFKPQLGIIMETELWPNLLKACHQRAIPIMLANARLSKRSTRRYAYIKSFTRQMLSSINFIGAQSRTDAKRFQFLGAAKDQLKILGNLKFDLLAPGDQLQKAKLARQQWSSARPTFIAASTHEGEETLILDALKIIKRSVPDILLVLVPRHPERFDTIATLCQQQGLHLARHHLGESPNEQTDVLLGDTMGEMFYFYALSDVAVVCGSFTPIGGHNILEPISLSIPVITGPYLFHLAEVSSSFPKNKCRLEVQNSDALAQAVIELITNQPLREALVKAASKAYQINQGALTRYCAALQELVSKAN